MLLASNLSTITFHAHHIENDGMMNQTVNRRHGGHRIFEDSFPFAEDQIRRDDHGLAFVALSEERKQHLHFVTIMLDVADIVENDAGKLVQFR